MDWRALIPGAYLALFIGAMFALAWWRRKIHKRRAPFKRETRALRQPGESYQRQGARLDDLFLMQICAVSAAPLFLVWAGLRASALVPGWSLLVGVAATTALFAIMFFFSARWAAKQALRRNDCELGWYGERVVGDALAPLERYGWRVFHDFPREVRGKKTNIDHIAVGPSGVFAIETRSPRTGNAVNGTEDHVVVYNGEVLSWPWGDDRLGLDQAIDNANWLSSWLSDRTMLKLRVEPVLTFPDWFVREQRAGSVRVLNTMLLPRVLTSRTSLLTSEQIGFVAAQLEPVCRDVEY